MVAEITSAVEFKKLELREREKEREVELHLKELEFKEHELAMQPKIRVLELAAATPTSTSRHTEFDVSKQIHFVPVFQKHEVDKCFLHFGKIASSLEWSKEMWIPLLQSVLVGKHGKLTQPCQWITVLIMMLSNVLFSKPMNWCQRHTTKNS